MLIVMATLFGLAIGSFSCVVIDRLPVPLDEPNEFGERFTMRPWAEVAGGRSRCSACGTDVPAHLNVPVFAWLFLRGRCKNCGASIGAFHPMVEASVPLLWLALAWALGWGWTLVPMLWFVPVAVIVGVIDLRTLMVPTKLVWPAAGISVVLIAASAVGLGETAVVVGALLGAAVLSGALFVIWFAKPGGLGFGDVRLAVLIGLHIGALVGTGGMILVVFSVVLTMGVAAFVGLILGGVLWAQGNRRTAPVMPVTASSPEQRSPDDDLPTEASAQAMEGAAAVAGDEPEATGISTLAVPFGPALLAAALIVAAASPQLIYSLGL
ncbi:MAG: prepilin peptidase [Candidatus Microthrix sp.]|uniref:Prepilin peptidase n=1 Tax=Candidatus Neomicrothrix subdominans TaxID=2954438 RepID=A0A936NDD5_9ACTN|nr:prepilin peptidase [Candidatus Microthrix sp.]MBK9296976.1 prepilin peptidase [Candidatus Microthrix subdominans]